MKNEESKQQWVQSREKEESKKPSQATLGTGLEICGAARKK